MFNAIVWIIIIVVVAYIYLRRKNKIPKLIEIKPSVARGSRSTNIDQDNTVEQWSQLLVGMGGRGEELLKTIVRKIKEMNIPDTILARKEATLGKSDYVHEPKHEFISVIHDRYPDYELWIGAIDRAGQLKVSWYLTVALPNRITSTMRALNQSSKEASFIHAPRSSKKFGRAIAARINEKYHGRPVVRVRPHEMTLDDKEEFGTYITIIHQAVLGGLEEMMNDLNLDFTKVDKHTQGFLNIS